MPSPRLPLLRVPEWRDDIAPAREALGRLTHGARTLIFFGTGGSSLGGQTLAQLGGWGIPGDDKHGSETRPRTRFYDNLDARTLELALSGLDLKSTRFVVISKSGGTPETLVQIIAAIDAVRKAGLAKRIPELFLAVTEPKAKGAHNGLRALCESFGIPTLDHDPNIGGRFSGLTNVGLLPALARGLDVEALRAGARSVVEVHARSEARWRLRAAIGAAVTIGLAKERGVRACVMLPYADRLVALRRLVCAALEREPGQERRGDDAGRGPWPGRSAQPAPALSRRRAAAPHHRDPRGLRRPRPAFCRPTSPSSRTPIISPAVPPATSSRREQRAIPEALMAQGRPVRTIDLEVLDERALGALMMHFMLETILAAHLLGVDPFDQPAVELGKMLTRRYLAGEHARGIRWPSVSCRRTSSIASPPVRSSSGRRASSRN